MPDDRFNERIAREIVSSELKLPVRRFDDGSRASMVDALIVSPLGDFPLEVVGDYDIPYGQQLAALRKYGESILVDGVAGSWYVTLTRASNVRRVHAELPAILRELHQALPDIADRHSVPAELRELGVRRIARLGTSSEGWNVLLSQGGWSGSAGADDLAEWVSRVLDAQNDVAAKLGAHGGSERHAFIWATVGSLFGAQHALMDGDPRQSPQLPPEVTHVWVAGMMSSQGAVYWSPAEGWRRTAFKWSPEMWS